MSLSDSDFQTNNQGFKYNLEWVLGLRHRSIPSGAAHGAVVISKSQQSKMFLLCSFFEGTPIVGNIDNEHDVYIQLQKMLDTSWRWMSDSDIYLTCHGMALPGPDQPFWKGRGCP
jgi:hypothetical protein